jgi:DNA-binding Xre family transcriptional regulator
MYISYSNLWKLLIDKGITKTELMELAKISSRTLAKLTKNQTVTTETLLSVCEALSCNISDIMEVRKGEESVSFFEALKRNGEEIDDDRICKTYHLFYKDKKYVIKKQIRAVGKHSIIRVEEDKIVLVQMYPLGWSPAREETVITKKNFANEGEIGIFITNGTPLYFKGLDENGYCSYRTERKKQSDIYVLTKAELKLFEPK